MLDEGSEGAKGSAAVIGGACERAKIIGAVVMLHAVEVLFPIACVRVVWPVRVEA